MDIRIQKLIDFTKTKWSLDDYYLQRHKLYRNVNIFNDTVYTLCMEWFPNHVVEQEDDDSNPEGTAVIDIDVNSGQFESVIFVGGKTYANDGIMFANLNTEDIIKWIEHETGLQYGSQFQLGKEGDGELHFKECFDGITTSPSGTIEIRYDQEGKLTFFSVNGPFPFKGIVKKETYTLSLEMVEHLAKKQLNLIEVPLYEQKRLVSVYAVEEIYVRNDQTSTIPFQFIVNENARLHIDEIIYWETMIKKPFERKVIDIFGDVTAEQAFSCELHPDLFPLTKLDQEKCVLAVKDFLRQQYPNDSGKWLFKTLHRDKGYIHATLRAHQQTNRIFQREISVMIDAKSFQALNYMDNKPMLEIFDQFQSSEKVTITKEEAYEKVKQLLELQPFYVYDFEQKQYVLCGKLDCQYGIDAGSGEVVALADL